MPFGRSSLVCMALALLAPSLAGDALHAQKAIPDTSAGGRDSIGPRPALTAPLPVDSAVTVGQLPNGLRYYIRVNHEPRNRAELRLVVNVGSILEDSSQRGVAHFVEHMAFNGTTHFARQELVDYLESTGVRFGADLNASTSFDETIYRLTVPTDSAGLLARGVQVLEDWAHGLTFDPAEIDRERGVVVEEWRTGRGAGQRISDKIFPVLFAGSRYAKRLPIGNPETIRSVPRKTLVDFYDEWYRPGLMAVVAVGDFDRDSVEQLIRQHFSGMKSGDGSAARPVYPVPPHDSTLVAVATDPEATSSAVAVYYLQAVREERTVGDYRQELVEDLYNSMLNSRFREIAQRADPPFLGAGSAQGRVLRSSEAYVLSALVADSGIRRGLGALLTESERVVQHGFTPTELERQKRELLRAVERAYDERDKLSSSTLVGDYVDNFLSNEPMMGIGEQWKLTKELLPGIELAEVNELAERWLRGKNRVITASAPARDSANVPTGAELVALADSVEATQVVAYVDSAATGDLVENPPEPGRIVGSRTISDIGVTEWKLSNGARVLLKPTDFKDDQLVFRAFSPGGTSLAPDSLFVPARTATSVVVVGGVGHFSATELEKALAGKSVNVTPTIGAYQEGIAGGGSPKDARTIFQLIYLYFTAPRPDSTAFLSYQTRVKAFVANRGANPSAAFSDTLEVILARHHPRAEPLTSATFDKMNLQESLDFYRDRFADASDFTFVFVGNIDTTTIKPLVERYIASLPATHRKESWRDIGMDYPRGVIHRDVHKGSDEKSQTQIVFSGPFDYTRHDVYLLSALVDVLQIRLRDRLREQLGGTYGVGVSASPTPYPRERYAVAVGFGSAPDRVEELTRAAFAEIDSLKKFGPTDADMEKVKEIEIRERESAMRENNSWLSLLSTYVHNRWDPRDILAYGEEVKKLKASDIRDAARKYLDEHNYVSVSLYPAEPTAGS
ncbi:MAG TPA: insulinase family protein [Gemmatimonadaceae bacterium]|nr:insulinase family protein [Gemmatimonadaceae bacterium]